METAKEKLIKLIQNGGGFKCGDDAGTFADIPCDGCRYEASEDCMAERIADALIQNGVTIQECGMDCKNCWKTKIVNPVQEWVSVDERLPEQCGMPVLMVAVNKFGQQAIVKGFSNYDCPSGFLTNEKEYDHIWDAWKVTHWMPLPEPPKEK